MTGTPTFDGDSAGAFLRDLARMGQVHLVAIAINGLSVEGREFGTDADAATAWAATRNGNGANVYWTVNEVRVGLNGKPKKSDITGARFAHVDIDPPKTGGAFDKAGIIASLEELAVPPSFIIDSGGGLQAFWRFDGAPGAWPANLDAIEAINMGLRDYFGADACWNIDRLMRVPGTVNWPDRRKAARGRVPTLATMVRGDDGAVYEPAELAVAFPASAPVAAPVAVAFDLLDQVEAVSPDSLGLSAFDPLRFALASPPGQDRSGDALAAARLMVNEGHGDAAVIGALLNPTNAVSAHCYAQRDPRRAAARCLQLVRQDGPPAGVTLEPVAGHSYFDPAALIANIERRMGSADVLPTVVEPEPRWFVPAGLPAWRRDLTGGLSMFVEHVTCTARSPQPWVALGGALAMFGTIAGRRYAGPTGLRTNIYSIGIVDSGGGKDWPLRQVVELMIEADCARMLGGEALASGAGIISAIEASPSILFPIDEIGFVIKAAANRDRAAPHKVEIVDVLTRFYSQAGARFLGTEYANKKERPRQVIEQPCLSLFGMTTPGVFWGSLSSDNVLDGSLARMLIFASECEYPDLQEHSGSSALPPALVEVAASIKLGAEGHNAFPLGDGPAAAPKPYAARYANAAAHARAREIDQEQLAMLRSDGNEAFRPIIARLAQNAFKVALIKAIADNPLAPEIDTRDLDWGYLVASRSVDALRTAVKDRVADNEHEAQRKRVHKVVADAGAGGIDQETLGRACQFMQSRRHLNDALDFLADAGRIRPQDMARADGKAGRGKRIWFDAD